MRKLSIAIATLGLGAGLLAVSPAATAATTADVTVKAGTITLFEHDDFGGKKATFGATDCDLRNNTWANSSTKMDNQASSMSNGRNASVWLWSGDRKRVV